MTGMHSIQIMSGLAVQQQYESTALSSSKTSGERTRSVTRLTEDTVDISSQAYALFRTQEALSDMTSPAATDTEKPETGSGTDAGEVSEASGSDISDRIEEVKLEISSLESELAFLEESAQTDDIAASLLRSKQARLRTLVAMLTGLAAKSMLPA